MELEEYDRNTVEYVAALGATQALVERVERLAKDLAYYKAEAAAWKHAAHAASKAGAR